MLSWPKFFRPVTGFGLRHRVVRPRCFDRRGIALGAVLSLTLSSTAYSQGQSPEQRLQSLEKNKFRRAEAVADMNKAKENMKQLFEPILVSGKGDGKADKWYSPHLRDIAIDEKNRKLESFEVRGQTAPMDFMALYCLNPWSAPIDAACPLGELFGIKVCKWHGEPFGPHRPIESCFVPNTLKYKELLQDSNFKTCCVLKAEAGMTSEQIASRHTKGDGWAGIYEVYFPTQALGWENDRTTTMIADKQKVDKCFKESDQLLKNDSVDWVTKAITLNQQKAGGGGSGSSASEIRQNVQDVAKDVHPQDEKIRMTDSLQSEGLTLRVNLAAMDPEHRQNLAQRVCGRKNQFAKLMDPAEDPVQKGGGAKLQDLDTKIPVWSNYCKEGVELMTDPDKSFLIRNLDKTPTNFVKGMEAWKEDPLFCQRMNLQNPNMFSTKIGEVIMKTPGGTKSQQQVGYTCLSGGKLNGSMVPVEMTRHAAVERRTAIADHAIGFLIAGSQAEGMHDGQKSYYKRFEPQPYSAQLPFQYKTFIGPQWKGGGKNEMDDDCPSVNGDNYRFANKSDRLYISNKTHQPFTQEKIDEESGGINKYVQEWATDDKKKDIAKRGLDDKSQNYAAPFRIFATCPAGMVRWRPPPDNHDKDLNINLENFCREEFLGGLP